MRLKISKSKNAAFLYVIKDITVNNKRTTKIVEKLGVQMQDYLLQQTVSLMTNKDVLLLQHSLLRS